MRIGAKPWVYRWALRDVSICTELTWLREVLPPRVKGKQTNNNIFSFHIYDSDSIIPSSLCGYVAYVAWHDISFFNSFVFRCSFKSKLKRFNFNRFLLSRIWNQRYTDWLWNNPDLESTRRVVEGTERQASHGPHGGKQNFSAVWELMCFFDFQRLKNHNHHHPHPSSSILIQHHPS